MALVHLSTRASSAQPYATGYWQPPPSALLAGAQLQLQLQRVPDNGAPWNGGYALPTAVEDRAARDSDGDLPTDLIDNPARPPPDDAAPSTRHTLSPSGPTNAPNALEPLASISPRPPGAAPSNSPSATAVTPPPNASKSPAPTGRQTPSPSPTRSSSPSPSSTPSMSPSSTPSASPSPSPSPSAGQEPSPSPNAQSSSSPPSASPKPDSLKKNTSKPAMQPAPSPLPSPSSAPPTTSAPPETTPAKDANDASPLSETASSGRATSSGTPNMDVALMIALAVCGVIAVSAFVLVRRHREPPADLNTPMDGATARAGFDCGVGDGSGGAAASLSPRRRSSSSAASPTTSVSQPAPLPTIAPAIAAHRTARVLSVHHDSVLSVSTIPEGDEDCSSVPDSFHTSIKAPEEMAFVGSVAKPSIASSCGASEYELNMDSFYAVTMDDRCSGDSVGPTTASTSAEDEPLASSGVSQFAATAIFSKEEPKFDYEMDVLSDHGDGDDDDEVDKSFHSDLDDSFMQREDSYAESYGRLSGGSGIRDSQDSLFSSRSSRSSSVSNHSFASNRSSIANNNSALFHERLSNGSL
ncbi:hypothetical protein PINS_up007559 [Pythium insidiosum]|nr:hypothetical protein PINS_up007559 [Pythium insidiosum]